MMTSYIPGFAFIAGLLSSIMCLMAAWSVSSLVKPGGIAEFRQKFAGDGVIIHVILPVLGMALLVFGAMHGRSYAALGFLPLTAVVSGWALVCSVSRTLSAVRVRARRPMTMFLGLAGSFMAGMLYSVTCWSMVVVVMKMAGISPHFALSHYLGLKTACVSYLALLLYAVAAAVMSREILRMPEPDINSGEREQSRLSRVLGEVASALPFGFPDPVFCPTVTDEIGLVLFGIIVVPLTVVFGTAMFSGLLGLFIYLT
ncbi:hypothetical protein ACTVH1_17035 [Gluconobacter cerinus]